MSTSSLHPPSYRYQAPFVLGDSGSGISLERDARKCADIYLPSETTWSCERISTSWQSKVNGQQIRTPGSSIAHHRSDMSDFSPITAKPSLAELSDTTIRQRKVLTDTVSPKVEHPADTTASDDNGKQKASDEEVNWGKTPAGDGE